MQLHQLLRHITDGTRIMLFDLKGNNILKVNSKLDIPVDLYEYVVLEFTVGVFDMYYTELNWGLYITLQK